MGNHEHVTRHTARTAAVQAGEFAIGVVAAYVVVGAAWAISASVWPPILLAVVLVAVAVAAEVRFGTRVTGFVAGVVPTAVVTAGLLAALVTVLSHLRS